MDTIARELSGGNKRKLCIALAMLPTQRLVFLDEPCSGVDVPSRKNVLEILRRGKQNRIMVVTTHDMAEARMLADTVGVME